MYKLAAWLLAAQSMQVAARAAVYMQPRTLDWLEACRPFFLGFRLRVQSVLVLLQSRPRGKCEFVGGDGPHAHDQPNPTHPAPTHRRGGTHSTHLQ